MTAFLEDGRKSRLTHRVQVAERGFPVKKLWVKEQYVRPPPKSWTASRGKRRLWSWPTA